MRWKCKKLVGSEILKVPSVLSLEEGIPEVGGCCNVIGNQIEDKAKDHCGHGTVNQGVKKGKWCLRGM